MRQKKKYLKFVEIVVLRLSIYFCKYILHR